MKATTTRHEKMNMYMCMMRPKDTCIMRCHMRRM
jgi:hypothetical protein